MLRWGINLFGAIFSVLVLAIGVWYAASFLPHLGELNKIAARGQESTRQVKNTIYPLAIASESKQGIRTYALRQAYYFLVYQQNRSTMTSWHLNNALWYLASLVHFSEDEVFAIWAECVLADCKNGLVDAAKKYFEADLNNLSEHDLAALVVLVKSPSRYAPGSERSEQRINELHKKVITQKSE